jgi:hypothetical protein
VSVCATTIKALRMLRLMSTSSVIA